MVEEVWNCGVLWKRLGEVLKLKKASGESKESAESSVTDLMPIFLFDEGFY